MEEVTGLVKFDAMHRAIVEAQTIDEAKNISDAAEALRVYAKQKNIAFQDQQRIAEIKLRAQRRIGELSSVLEKSNKWNSELSNSQAANLITKAEALESAGVSKDEAYRCEKIAAIPEDEFEAHLTEKKVKEKEITTSDVLRLAKARKKNERKAEIMELKSVEDEHIDEASKSYRVYQCAVSELAGHTEPGTVDAIITDPPYPREFLDVYTDLAEYAAYALKEGGSLVAMVGQSYLPEIISRLSKHLNYQWSIAYLTPGGQSPQIWNRKVNTFWKPLLWFVKGEYDGLWIGDVIKTNVNDNDKRFHYWGQNEYGISEIIDRVTLPGDLVVDPFLGGGTTGAVSIQIGRRFIGCDIDPECIVQSEVRMQYGKAG